MGWVIVWAIAAALLAASAAAWMVGRARRARAWACVPETTRTARAESAAPPSMEAAALTAMRRRFLCAALGVDADDAHVPDSPHHRLLANAVAAALERADLSQRYIPRRPHLLPQLILSVNDSNASARSIGRLVGSDPLLTMNLLRIVNSPLYRAQSQDVRSIERAVALVGTAGIRQIISAALVQPVMNPSGRDGGRFTQWMWDYTLRMSLAAADYARSEREDGFSAQLAGLLRGLGMAMVARAAADVCSQRQAQLPPPLLPPLLQRCAPALAARITREWAMPPDIAAALDTGGQATALARSLDIGELAAAVSVLCRENLIDEPQALQTLAACVPGHVSGWLWKRVNPGQTCGD